MRKHLISALIVSVAFPMAAIAQETTISPTQDQQTAPGATGTEQTPGATGTMTDTQPLQPTADAGMASGETFVTVPQSGAWRVSDLEGKPVYGSDGESIGDIKDVLVSQDGSVNAVVIGVGGFLGIGQKDVAVDMAALRLGPGATQADADEVASATPGVSNETTASTDSYGTDTGAGATTGGAAPGMTAGDATAPMAPDATTDMAAADAPAIRIGDDGLPERIILNVTRQDLEDAPEFQGVGAEQR